MTLTATLPGATGPDELFDTFVAWVSDQGLVLYPAQEEALMEIVSGSHVILATPTGSGKSLVATGAHASALVQGRRSFYTAPIKALVSEKFFAACDTFGADQVGMLTGDSSVNAEAPIICCTAEVLANMALRGGPDTDVGLVVMDEFHFYADPERGWAWQVPLLELRRAQFLLMSATLGDVTFFEQDLTRRTGRPTAVLRFAQRRVSLYFRYVTTRLHETLEELLATNSAPVYVVHFTQAAAAEQAQALTSINVCSRAEKDAIAELIGRFRFTAGFGRTLSRLVRHGIGVHHAGMLPRYRRLVERLAQSGLLKIVCGTDTLGVGINVPIRTGLLAAEPEALVSSFAVSHAMLLNVANRPGDAFAAMRPLLTGNHSDRPAQRRLIRAAIAMYRALLAAGVVERLPVPDEQGRTVRLTGDLQLDFALNQALSPFALAAIELLDPDSADYPLDVLSVLEATLEDPRQVLGAQLAKAKGEAVAAMKADGIEYEERMQLLDDISYPMPLADLLDAAFETYRQGHPWVVDHRLSPKSVARDIAERAMTFTEYVGFYGLARSE